jgi:hypothetical protein
MVAFMDAFLPAGRENHAMAPSQAVFRIRKVIFIM